MIRNIKVLIVDDEEQFRATTKKILVRRGFETILAGSGEEAIQKVAENPDVVILDIKMPGLDGLQALQEIKKLRPDLPVIMLTGHGSEPSAKEALGARAFDYLAKPCDIEVLAAKIVEASRHGHKPTPAEESRVREVMVPISDYTRLPSAATIKEAVEALRASFVSRADTGRIMETGHRSILVTDPREQVQGILTIVDLLEAVLPAYLSAPKPSMADSIQYSPMFWTGLFTREIERMGERRIEELMSPAPLTIADDANLMEAAYQMVKNQARRLAVVDKAGQVVGVIREQDMFFEIDRILKG